MVLQTKTNSIVKFLRNSQELEIDPPENNSSTEPSPFGSPICNPLLNFKTSLDDHLLDIGKDDDTSEKNSSSPEIYHYTSFFQNSSSEEESEEEDSEEDSEEENVEEGDDEDDWKDQFNNSSEINLSLSTFQLGDNSSLSGDYEEWSDEDEENEQISEWNMADSDDDEFNNYISSKPEQSLSISTDRLSRKPFQTITLENDTASASSFEEDEEGLKNSDSGCDTPWWFSKEDQDQVKVIIQSYTNGLKVNEGAERRIREPQPFIGLIKRRKVENESNIFQTFDCVKVYKRSLIAPHCQLPVQKTLHILTSWSSDEGIPLTFFEIKKKNMKDFWKKRITSELPSYLYALPISTTDHDYHYFVSHERSKTLMYSPCSPIYKTETQSFNYLWINCAIESNPQIKAKLFPPTEDEDDVDFF